MEEENPLKSIRDTIAFSSMDWGQDQRSAWIYGVVFGWNNPEEGEDRDSIYKEFQVKFGWTNETVERLKRLHSKYEAIQDLLTPNKG